MITLRSLALAAALGGLWACSSNDGTTGQANVGDAGGSSQGTSTGQGDASSADAGCPAAQTCAAQCCGSGEACAKDSSGNLFCAKSCATSGECSMDAPCCDPSARVSQPGATSAGGVCMPEASQACLCTTSTDCTSAACAPAVDSSGHPVGPYVCVPNTGSPYTGCHGLMTCTAPYCCVTDKNGNEFCAPPCTGDSTCGPGHCDAFDFSASSCTGGSKACGL